jgi:hypothetical protein
MKKRSETNSCTPFTKRQRAARPDCPEAWRLGFSKHIRFNLNERAIVDNSEEKSGYILGEKLGFLSNGG